MGRKKGIPRKTTTLHTDHQSSESEAGEVRQIQETPASQLGETPLDLTVRTGQTQFLRNVPDVSKESKSRQDRRSARDTSSNFGEMQLPKRPRMEDQEDKILDPSTSTAHLSYNLPGPSSGSNQSRIEGVFQLTQNSIPRAGSIQQMLLQKPLQQVPSTSSHNFAGNAGDEAIPRGKPSAENVGLSHGAYEQGEPKRSKEVQCPYCSHVSSNIYGWRKHLKSYDHDHLKFCDVYPCGREFDTDQELEKHKSEDHTDAEIKNLTIPVDMIYCPFCQTFQPVDINQYGHVYSYHSRPKGRDVIMCQLHSKNMYFRNAEEKEQHDETVHKNH